MAEKSSTASNRFIEATYYTTPSATRLVGSTLARQMVMDTPPTVLCAIDYSAASQTALRYAASAVTHLKGRLAVLTVIDPLLAEAMAASHRDWQDTERHDLREFCKESLGAEELALDLVVDVRIGKPAAEILATAERMEARLIVMGCHGLTGIRKMFFGSTTERVLRDTAIAVLVVPADLQADRPARDLAGLVRHIIVAVDISDNAQFLTALAARLGANIRVPVILVHVIEPLTLRARWRGQLPSLQTESRQRAEMAVDRLVEQTEGQVEPLILFGEPAGEIAKAAEIRGAGLVVIGLQHGGTGRVGVIAYRILTSTQVPVLAVPAVLVDRLQGACVTTATSQASATASASRVAHI